MKVETNIEKLTLTMENEKGNLYRYAYYRIGDEQEAQDLIQELYLKLYTDKTLLNNVANLKSYIYRSLSNSCTATLRERQKHPHLEITENDFSQIAVTEPENLEEEFAQINRLLRSIPEEQSEVIRLRIHSNKSFVEIAEILEIPPTTAKSRFKYGIDKLRDGLEKQGLI